jgi:DNA mismatch repair protein MutS
VAKLAGVPKAVIDSAKRKLAELERLDVVNASNAGNKVTRSRSEQSSSQHSISQHSISQHSISQQSISQQSNDKKPAPEIKRETQLSMSFETPEHWLEQKIKKIDIDDLTPRQALALLYQWRKELK